MALDAMVTVTSVPLFVTMLFRGMPGLWKGRHRLMLGWLVFMQALFPGHKTLEELARWTPAQVTALRFRPLLSGGYWDIDLLVGWWGWGERRVGGGGGARVGAGRCKKKEEEC